jgi:geranylgeranyl diphosphate synthase, type II
MSSDRTRALRSHYADLTRRLVLDSIPVGEPGPHLYHLVTEHLTRPAKALRPTLCLATCGALGGSIEDALPVAAALELHHDAFLVHDDIEDGSPTRSGRRSLHEQHGLELALNAGDALTAIAVGQLGSGLRRLDRRRADAIAHEFDRLVAETVEGQATELGWHVDGRTDLTAGDYLRMVTKKTAWYTAIGPVRIGALLASGGSIEPDFGIRFGIHLGVAFQMANDIADALRCAKSPGTFTDSDIHEGKRTIMMIHLLANLTGEERDHLVGFLRSKRQARSDADARRVVRLMSEKGSLKCGVDRLREVATAGAREARQAFGGLPDSADRDLLIGIFPHTVRALTAGSV